MGVRDRQLADWRHLEPEVQALLSHTTPEVVGARVKRHRLRQGMSIRELAGKAGVSTNSVLRIERGGGVHALTLLKICASLGIHVVRLGDAEQLESAAVHHAQDDRWFDLTRFGDGPLKDRPLSAAERAKLVESGQADVPLMIMRSQLESGRLMQSVIELHHASEPRHHPGEEFIYVLEGSAVIKVGAKTYELAPGEGICFWSAEEHSYAPAEGSSLPVRLLSVIIGDTNPPSAR